MGDNSDAVERQALHRNKRSQRDSKARHTRAKQGGE